jgi:hypothetical protein
VATTAHLLVIDLMSLISNNAISIPSYHLYSNRDGCETWSLNLKEEHRLRVFENRVLRKVFGPRGAEKST